MLDNLRGVVSAVLFSLVATALILTGLPVAQAGAAQAETAQAWSVNDALGRRIVISDASRVISIGASVTEIIYALGEQDRIIGVDTTSKHPEAATAKPQVGYMRALSSEGVLSLNPDLILAIDGAGPPRVIETLKRASIPFVVLPSKFEGTSAMDKIRMVAEALGVAGKGREMAAQLALDVQQASAAISKIPSSERLRVLFMWNMQRGTPIGTGRNTAADAMIKLAGGVSVFNQFEGYKPIAMEALISAAPQAVLAMSIGRHSAKPDDIWKLPHMKATPAGRDKKLILMDPAYILGFGPRTAHAMLDLARALYPDRDFPVLPERPWTSGARSGS